MLLLKIYSARNIKTCFGAQTNTSLIIDNMMKLNIWRLIILLKYLEYPSVKKMLITRPLSFTEHDSCQITRCRNYLENQLMPS